MNLENLMLNERNQIQKMKSYIILLKEKLGKCMKISLCGCQGLWGAENGQYLRSRLGDVDVRYLGGGN